MLDIQTEHLENHTTRLTVTVDDERVQKAMRQAARQIAKKARIPGFRPGKAPFNVVLNLYGPDYVLNEALDKLGNDVYREALDAAELEPYAPGSLEKVDPETESGLQLTFIVPKVPTVELGDYRDIRLEQEVEEITDEMVNDAMESLREGQAVIEPVERPIAIGDQVVLEHFEIVLVPQDGDEDGDEDLDDT
ncbi:MAG: trigger factor family protein, partial [Chloroflexi bacterium]|nr:trigger factor family protein [Chloroflexota bacterium]